MSRFPSMLVFGPQTSLPSASYLFQVRASLLLDPRLQSFRSALEDLPSLWPILLAADPTLDRVPGAQCLNDLSRWLLHGDLPPRWQESQPSTFITPLTVILHTVQYFHYIDSKIGGTAHEQVLQSIKSQGGVQGFCTGLLTAVAIASAKDEEALCIWAGAALRLAVCIGAYVDSDGIFNTSPNDNCCLAVKWRPDFGKEKLMECLRDFPGAYISALSDSTCVTVTVSTAISTALSHELAAQGFIAKPVSLNGRFHSSAHEDAAQKLIKLCASNSKLQLPSASSLLAPVRSNTDGQLLTGGFIHDIVIESVLVELCNWHATISTAASQLVQEERPNFVQFGLIDCIPSVVIRSSGAEVVKLWNSNAFESHAAKNSVPTLNGSITPPYAPSDDGSLPSDAIAIIGMGCKFPGADSIDEFWDLISAGTSMCKQMSEERFKLTGLRRSPEDKLKFWGNFVNDIDAFDHRFFKKSSREAATMDPQQRLLLQVAYEALESSEYYGRLGSQPSNDIGCYVGVCASDYNDNVASHPPNAYSSLGTLRAFLSGKISHFFGWTGPSITYDTACSSSAVAIHAACKAIQSGECSMALAGGVSLYTSPNFYQNLAAASFLSPTGPTKPFDAKGDGYCRGEGIGLVLLKRLSDAIAENDNVMGVIAATAVNQNENSTSITVPHSASQVRLYNQVSSKAGIQPHEVSFVEAHGTGTPVGDPIEFASIRESFGGAKRVDPLYVASVKGNIGHLEGASGVASVIKTVLMMKHKSIPIQANYSKLNPKIAPLEGDNLIIPLSTQPWNTKFQVACINNYGAAGSNAAMIICEAPKTDARQPERQMQPLAKYPLYVSANSPDSLKAYCIALLNTVERLSASYSETQLLHSLTFNLANKQNRSLPYVITASVSNMSELKDQLIAGTSGLSSIHQQAKKKAQPAVLVFGGQTNRFVGLNRAVFDSSALLRFHLDRCDDGIRSEGLNSIFPAIFQTEPVEDVVLLHSMFFAIQYACAKSWIAAGLRPSSVMGHSFGQITALCISGVLSLKDGVKLVTGRAKLMQSRWASERGSMISVQADIDTILGLIAFIESTNSEDQLEIACYNGTNSHVLVGRAKAIDRVELLLGDAKQPYGSIKNKRLDVTHGFHSKFTEPLLLDLTHIAQKLTFHEPIIPIETCSEGASWSNFSATLIAEHTRSPVYFGQAVERLTSRLGPCTWLEAGSGSSVTGMVRSALGAPSTHFFQAIQLSGLTSMALLADITVNLWKAGHNLQFWPFDRHQRSHYSALSLPPYQFEKNRHWLGWTDTAAVVEEPVLQPKREDSEPVFLAFIGYRDAQKEEAEFHVDTRSVQYKFFVKGHAVLGESLCPAPLYIELASQTAMILNSGCKDSGYIPCVEDLEIKAPLGASDCIVSIILKQSKTSMDTWAFSFSSNAADSVRGSSQLHATGSVRLQLGSPSQTSDFARFERLVGSHKCDDIMADSRAEALQGNLVYKVFGKVVTYADYYKGVKSVYAKDREVVGNVTLSKNDNQNIKLETILNPLAMDNFIQVAGLHVNSMTEIGNNEVYVCTKVDRIQPGPSFTKDNLGDNKSWIVYSNYHPTSNKEVVNDIFVFDKSTKALVFLVLGARFTRVLISSLTRVLSRANGSVSTSPSATLRVSQVKIQSEEISVPVSTHSTSFNFGTAALEPLKPSIPTRDISSELKKVLHEVTEVPIADFTNNATLEDLGVDSLMITEVLSEINKAFQISISMDEFATMPDVGSVIRALEVRVNVVYNGVVSESDSEDDIMTMSMSHTTNQTTGATTPASISEATPKSESVFELANLVATHLEIPNTMALDTNLADQGLDSLLSIELASDIKKVFGADVDMAQLNFESTFGDLVNLVMAQVALKSKILAPSAIPLEGVESPATGKSVIQESHDGPASVLGAQQAFEDIRFSYDVHTKETGFYDFWKKVYPTQARLVLAYTVECFAQLGCDLALFKPGEKLPSITYLPKHEKLVSQLYNVLRDGLLVATDGSALVRSDQPLDATPSTNILSQIHAKAPRHTSEHNLLHITASKLAGCLTGAVDPLSLLFRSKENRELLEDVYANGPMYEAVSRLLCSYLGKAFSKQSNMGQFHILELGGGTGGTTRYVVDYLVSQGIPFTYTFTDLSGSLVAAARKKFAGRSYMQFRTIDIEKEPADEFIGRYHAVISTNCIHATKNLEVSTKHIRKVLRPDGFVSMVEFTRNMFWFDLVFGLLDGWWLFNDGRQHVLASEWFWDASMRKAGYQHVTWTDGTSLEARTLRIITGFNAPPENSGFVPQNVNRDTETAVETVLYKQVGSTALFADVYYPPMVSTEGRPIALMIHGGGHVMLSRKDIRPKQTTLLHSLGFLPVSIDYRLCPEVTLPAGPMADVCDGLAWARTILPSLQLMCPGLKIDSSRTVVVGWSTGGHLAMTTAFTTIQCGIAPPTAILAFYCPTDYEDPCWARPNHPEDTNELSQETYNLLEGVQEKPITAYNVPAYARAVGGWMAPQDPRSRIVLHMNWKGQCLPVLLRGLPSGSHTAPAVAEALISQSQPGTEEVQVVSPYAQIKKGLYRTPTFVIHGTEDDLIPWSQSVRTVNALKENGVRAEVEIARGKVHLFDLYRDKDGSGWEIVNRGYQFLAREVFGKV